MRLQAIRYILLIGCPLNAGRVIPFSQLEFRYIPFINNVMETIKPTWTVLVQTFDSEELAKAYLVKEEKIKKASQDLSNLLNFQKKKLTKVIL